MTKGVSVTTKVELSGDFFRRNPGKTLRMNVRDMMDALAPWMQSEVRAQIESHAGDMPGYTGWSRDHTIGYTTSQKTGKRWGQWAAVGAVTTGMSKEDAIRTKAKVAGRRQAITSGGRNIGTTPGIERRWHPYRKVKSAVYRARPIIAANLSKGLE